MIYISPALTFILAKDHAAKKDINKQEVYAREETLQGTHQ